MAGCSRGRYASILAALLELVLLGGCAGTQSAEYDPCAGAAARGRQHGGGSIVIACYELRIPFRVRVVDADDQNPIAAAAVLECVNPLGEDTDQGRIAGWTHQDGTLIACVGTLVHTPNPYTMCFRQSFRGILVEIEQDGYEPTRLRVPLPEYQGQQIDLGTVALKKRRETSN